MSTVALDAVILSLLINGTSSTLTSLNFVSTGVVYGLHLPLYTLSIVVVALLLLSVLPILTAAFLLLVVDRHCSSGFFNNLDGGDSILYEHLFWLFGHPEVYILIIPAFAIVSSSSTTIYSILFGTAGMITGILSISLIGYLVWSHHAFQACLDAESVSYFTAATALIAIPTAVKNTHYVQTPLSSRNFIPRDFINMFPDSFRDFRFVL